MQPATLLRDPHGWIPELLLRRVLAVAEQTAQSKTVAYDAARYYFGTGRPSQPSLLELVAHAFSDVGAMVSRSHLWAGAYTTYLQLQALIPKPDSQSGGPGAGRAAPPVASAWLISRLPQGIPPIISLDQFLRGNYEGFTQLYHWVEGASCTPLYLQNSLDDVVAEFPGAALRWTGDFVDLVDPAGRVVAQGRRTDLIEQWIELDGSTVESSIVGAPEQPATTWPICKVTKNRAALFQPIHASSLQAPVTGGDASGSASAVVIVRGGTLSDGSLSYQFVKGEIYGAPYSCYRYQWQQGQPRRELSEGRAARQRISATLLQALQQVQSMQGKLLTATIGHQELSVENLTLRRRLEQPAGHPTILGQSRAVREMCRMIDLLAETETTVLITGETGTGKELVAQAIHRQSARAERPFLAVNCGALTESLLESELFGHEKGAFTGAIGRRRGKFELAHTGTLFLDEVGEVSPGMQVRLLRVLQEKEIQRVGGEQTIPVDVRIVAATNQSLEELVSVGRFRPDLYYRLKVVPIKVPPLRERRDDILLLAEHFRREYTQRLNRQTTSMASEMMASLLNYSWPGNVRELRHVMERAVLLAGDQTTLTCDLLPPEIEPARAEPPSSPALSPSTASVDGWLGIGDWSQCADLLKQYGSLDQLLTMIEWQIVSKAMAAHGGNKSRTAKALGRSYRWLRKLETRLQPSTRVLESPPSSPHAET